MTKTTLKTLRKMLVVLEEEHKPLSSYYISNQIYKKIISLESVEDGLKFLKILNVVKIIPGENIHKYELTKQYYKNQLPKEEKK